MTDELIESAFEHEVKLSFATNVEENADKVVYLEYHEEYISSTVIETFAELLDAVEWEVCHYEDGEPSYVRYIVSRPDGYEAGDEQDGE